jgi:peptidoglycan/xylan/chitin deacetylase (PgdA/CDA1 family)
MTLWRTEASGFPGMAAAVYKLDVREMKQHFDQIAASNIEQPSTIHDLLRDPNGGQVPLLLTFDDGGVSAALHIADLLEGFGWKGHFMVTAGQVNRRAFLSTSQLQGLRKRGHIIGSHSWSHPHRMSSCAWNQLIEEWDRSTRFLSDILGERVVVASVPGGYFSKKVAEAGAACGIRALFTSEPVKTPTMVNGCMVLGRYTIFRGMPTSASLALSSGTTSASQAKAYSYWSIKKAVKLVAGKHYLAMREIVLSQ